AGPAIAPPPLPGIGATRRTMEITDEQGEFALPSWNDGASQVLPREVAPPGMPRVETRAPSVGAIANSLHNDLSQKDSLIQWLNQENQKLRSDLQHRENLLQHVNAELARARA